jgi:hypothetical protein
MRKNQLYKAIIPLFIVLLIGAILVYSQRNDQQKEDLLIVWGQVADEPGATWRSCQLWTYNPRTQETSLPFIQEDKWCTYEIIEIVGQKRLISLEANGEVVIYEITDSGSIQVEQTLSLGSGYSGSIPQWGKDNSIFFSTVIDNQEQIARLDAQTESISSIIVNESGLATDPILSPDGQYLAYWTVDGPINRTLAECGLECAGYYHIFNLQDKIDVPLASLLDSLEVDPLVNHCSLQWSPSGRFLAFNIGGCGQWSERDIVVVDAHTNQIVSYLRPQPDDYYFSFEGWLSDTEVVYSSAYFPPELGYAIPHYSVYSLDTQTSRELISLPSEITQEGVFASYDIDWTTNGRYIVGSVPISNSISPEAFSLVTADISQDQPQIESFFFEDDFANKPNWVPFQEPKWSPSGDWIAYRSSYQAEGGFSPNNIYIVNRAGETIQKIDTINIARNLHYVWLK